MAENNKNKEIKPGTENQEIPFNELIKTSEHQKPGIFERIVTVLSIIIIILTLPFSLLVCIKIVTEYQRAVIFRLGRLKKGGARGPGVFFIIPCIETFIKADLRTETCIVEPQLVLTKDSVTIKVDAVLFSRLYDPLRAIIQVRDYYESTQLLSQTTLRNICGTKLLIELLSNKEAVSAELQEILDEATDRWGVQVERVEIKDVNLPQSMQRAMAAEAEAGREAKAKLISAEGEKSASQALKEASDIISSNPTALQLRYLQTLHVVAAEKTSTLIFPFPIQMFAMYQQ